MYSVADVLMYLRTVSNLEEMFMMWGGRDNLKFQQHDCHLVIRLSEYTGVPSGINYIHLLFHFDWKMFQEKDEDLLNFKIFLKVNTHDHVLSHAVFLCSLLLWNRHPRETQQPFRLRLLYFPGRQLDEHLLHWQPPTICIVWLYS